ncbi:MAG: imidazolonepropionase [Flavobacteriales bacterium]|nr:imidazolonepropionase [Flavobacteriales bacterium]MCB9447821.1 imidazolonepropionase [Flavobacteriales bacterium]
MKLIGPFTQIVTLNGLPLAGPLADDRLEIILRGGVLVQDGVIVKVGDFNTLQKEAEEVEEITGDHVLMPGFIDAHTHICFAGSRAGDYASRIAGKSYVQILEEGGGIMDTVRKTRAATSEELIEGMVLRCNRLTSEGVTTCEVKSGYGLSLEDELKMLRAIREANDQTALDLVSTCLAAHVKPPEFEDAASYVGFLIEHVLPVVKSEQLANRADVFVEPSAFAPDAARTYLQACRDLGFAITVHADQFTAMGSMLAAEFDAVSADHLEAVNDAGIAALKKKSVIATVLPGATLGLGMPFAPARKLLDAGLCLVIASDWNPGSAPMGNLLLQAAVMGAAEKLTTTETLAAVTVRAAAALQLNDRGVIAADKKADMVAFPVADFREVLYHQGSLQPNLVWKNGMQTHIPH